MWYLQTLLLTTKLSVRLRYIDSDYAHWCLQTVQTKYHTRVSLITTLVSSNWFWLPLSVINLVLFWLPHVLYLQTLQTKYILVYSDYHIGVFKLFKLSTYSFILITTLCYLFKLFKLSTYSFILITTCGGLQTLQTKYILRLILITTLVCCLFVLDIRILTTPLVSSNSSFDHCVVCSSSI